MKTNRVIKNTCIILVLLMILTCMFSYVDASQGIIDMYNGNANDTEAGGGIAETRKIIGRIISIVQVFGIFIAVAMLMTLGIKYMYASPGDKAQIKQHLTVYVIGAVVMFGSSGILQIVKSFFINVSSST